MTWNEVGREEKKKIKRASEAILIPAEALINEALLVLIKGQVDDQDRKIVHLKSGSWVYEITDVSVSDWEELLRTLRSGLFIYRMKVNEGGVPLMLPDGIQLPRSLWGLSTKEKLDYLCYLRGILPETLVGVAKDLKEGQIISREEWKKLEAISVEKCFNIQR